MENRFSHRLFYRGFLVEVIYNRFTDTHTPVISGDKDFFRLREFRDRGIAIRAAKRDVDAYFKLTAKNSQRRVA